MLETVKKIKKPVFLHIITTKGKGYRYAEKSPSTFHWPAPFDIKTGNASIPSTGDSWFKHSHKKGIEYVKKYKNVYFVTPAFVNWGLAAIKKAYPSKVIDTGISEQHCVTFSSSLALNKNKVLCYIASMFLPRAFDQVIDVCLQKIPMVFVMYFSGIGDGGYTHQGIYTFPMLSMLPNTTIIHPYGLNEYDRLLDKAMMMQGPVFIQAPDENIFVKSFIGSMIPLRKGKKLTILPIGNMMGKALRVADNIQGVEVVYCPQLKPFDGRAFAKYVEETGKLLILEDGFVRGGLGESIVCDLQSRGVDFAYDILGVKDMFPEQGTLREVYEYVGLGDAHIHESALRLIKRTS